MLGFSSFWMDSDHGSIRHDDSGGGGRSVDDVDTDVDDTLLDNDGSGDEELVVDPSDIEIDNDMSAYSDVDDIDLVSDDGIEI